MAKFSDIQTLVRHEGGDGSHFRLAHVGDNIMLMRMDYNTGAVKIYSIPGSSEGEIVEQAPALALKPDSCFIEQMQELILGLGGDVYSIE